MEKHLDVVAFIRNQMMLNATFKILFNDVERFLLGNQKQFVLNQSQADLETSDSEDSDTTNFKHQEVRSKFYQRLLEGTQSQKPALSDAITNNGAGTQMAHMRNHTAIPINAEPGTESMIYAQWNEKENEVSSDGEKWIKQTA